MDSRRVHRAGVTSVLRYAQSRSPCFDKLVKALELDVWLQISGSISSLILLSRAARASKEPKAHCAGAPTVCMHVVSGSISLPSRGSFRLSLTVLVHYRSITSI